MAECEGESRLDFRIIFGLTGEEEGDADCIVLLLLLFPMLPLCVFVMLVNRAEGSFAFVKVTVVDTLLTLLLLLLIEARFTFEFAMSRMGCSD